MWSCGAGAHVALDATNRPNRITRQHAVRLRPLDCLVIRRRTSFMIRPSELTFTLLLALACSTDRGFRFQAEYGAPRSGYRLRLISQGWVESGYDLSENAFALVQFCPVAEPGARPFRVSLASRPAAFDRIASADPRLRPHGDEAGDRRGHPHRSAFQSRLQEPGFGRSRAHDTGDAKCLVGIQGRGPRRPDRFARRAGHEDRLWLRGREGPAAGELDTGVGSSGVRPVEPPHGGNWRGSTSGGILFVASSSCE